MICTIPPDHPCAVIHNDQVIACYSKAIMDDKESVILNKAKPNEYPKPGLAYKCFQAIQIVGRQRTDAMDSEQTSDN